MPTDTMTEMILGFAVILAVLLVYFLTLIIRIRRAKAHYKNLIEK